MKLKAKDQVHISSVKRDSLRTGEEFEVSDAMGAELIRKRPDLFELAADDDAAAEAKIDDAPAEIAEEAPAEKSEHAPANKAEVTPDNKAHSGRSKKRGE